MEIDTSPRPLAPPRWGLLALSVVLLAPISIAVLLPLGLGLQHHVVTDAAGETSAGLARGTVALARVVPVSDLRVGDVITYPRPSGADEDATVTRRIVAIGPDGVFIEGDSRRGPWLLRPDGLTLPRVVVAVPWIGWLYVAFPRGWSGGGLALGLAVIAVLVAVRVRRRVRRRRPAEEADAAGRSGLNSE